VSNMISQRSTGSSLSGFSELSTPPEDNPVLFEDSEVINRANAWLRTKPSSSESSILVIDNQKRLVKFGEKVKINYNTMVKTEDGIFCKVIASSLPPPSSFKETAENPYGIYWVRYCGKDNKPNFILKRTDPNIANMSGYHPGTTQRPTSFRSDAEKADLHQSIRSSASSSSSSSGSSFLSSVSSTMNNSRPNSTNLPSSSSSNSSSSSSASRPLPAIPKDAEDLSQYSDFEVISEENVWIRSRPDNNESSIVRIAPFNFNMFVKPDDHVKLNISSLTTNDDGIFCKCLIPALPGVYWVNFYNPMTNDANFERCDQHLQQHRSQHGHGGYGGLTISTSPASSTSSMLGSTGKNDELLFTPLSSIREGLDENYNSTDNDSDPHYNLHRGSRSHVTPPDRNSKKSISSSTAGGGNQPHVSYSAPSNFNKVDGHTLHHIEKENMNPSSSSTLLGGGGDVDGAVIVGGGAEQRPISMTRFEDYEVTNHDNVFLRTKPEGAETSILRLPPLYTKKFARYGEIVKLNLSSMIKSTEGMFCKVIVPSLPNTEYWVRYCGKDAKPNFIKVIIKPSPRASASAETSKHTSANRSNVHSTTTSHNSTHSHTHHSHHDHHIHSHSQGESHLISAAVNHIPQLTTPLGVHNLSEPKIYNDDLPTQPAVTRSISADQINRNANPYRSRASSLPSLTAIMKEGTVDDTTTNVSDSDDPRLFGDYEVTNKDNVWVRTKPDATPESVLRLPPFSTRKCVKYGETVKLNLSSRFESEDGIFCKCILSDVEGVYFVRYCGKGTLPNFGKSVNKSTHLQRSNSLSSIPLKSVSDGTSAFSSSLDIAGGDASSKRFNDLNFFDEYEVINRDPVWIRSKPDGSDAAIVRIPPSNIKKFVKFGDRILLNMSASVKANKGMFCRCKIPGEEKDLNRVYWVRFWRNDGKDPNFEKCFLKTGDVVEMEKRMLKMNPMTVLPPRCSHPDCHRAPTARCSCVDVRARAAGWTATVCDKLFCEHHLTGKQSMGGWVGYRQCPSCLYKDQETSSSSKSKDGDCIIS
jgi:hypothetical protein